MVDIKTCQKCRHQWVARQENPVVCPRCRTYNWNIPIKQKKEKTQ